MNVFLPSNQTAGLGSEGHRRPWSWPLDSLLGMEVLDPRLAQPIRVGGLSIPLPGVPSPAGPLPAAQLERQMRQWPRGGIRNGHGSIIVIPPALIPMFFYHCAISYLRPGPNVTSVPFRRELVLECCISAVLPPRK